jgi:hypothetical protein
LSSDETGEGSRCEGEFGMMEVKPIQQEKTPYRLLLYKKSRSLRLWEMGIFLAGFFFMLPFFEVRSLSFVIALILFAALVMLGAPAIYWLVYRPRYTLYADRLEIQFGRSKEIYNLKQIRPAYDFPYVYQFGNTRLYLLVSDAFLESLETRLEMIKHGLDAQ